MMGHSHAVSGALGWFALAPVVAQVSGHSIGTPELIFGAVTCAGAALLPDLDHPQATISHFLGPVSVAVSKVVHAVAGGHRQATHSFAFCFLAGGATAAAGVAFGRNAVLVILFFAAGLALRGLGLAPPKKDPVVSGLAVAAEAAVIVFLADRYLPGTWWWLPFAIGLGCFLHLCGDCSTPEGCPLFWPNKWRFSLPIISRTGNMMETRIITPLMVLGLLFFMWSRILHPVASGLLAYTGLA